MKLVQQQPEMTARVPTATFLARARSSRPGLPGAWIVVPAAQQPLGPRGQLGHHLGGRDNLGDLADPLAGVQRHGLDVAEHLPGVGPTPTCRTSVDTGQVNSGSLRRGATRWA